MGGYSIRRLVRVAKRCIKIILFPNKKFLREKLALAKSKTLLTKLLSMDKIKLNNLTSDFSNKDNKTVLYIRLDYWNKAQVGGSITHTYEVIRELTHQCIKVVAVLPYEFTELKQLGIHQIVLACPDNACHKEILLSNLLFKNQLSNIIKQVKPDFIYERIIPGIFITAYLSQVFSIPYMTEYNGSEMIINKSFTNIINQYENIFIQAEKVVFRFSSQIIAVSKAVAEYMIKCQVDSNKILVNPNGANPNALYPDTKSYHMIRQHYGWSDKEFVVGFAGSFGGWHGIDIIIQVIDQILNLSNNIRFLIIGSGNHFSEVKDFVYKNNHQDKVMLTGTLIRTEAIKHLQACDAYLSPQQDNLKGADFFGSPVKVFEYMALGKAIIASDLMQIAEVLQPALAAKDLNLKIDDVTRYVAILCEPANVSEFVQAIVFLSKLPDKGAGLGTKARSLLIQKYTWEQHVNKIMNFISEKSRLEMNKILASEQVFDDQS